MKIVIDIPNELYNEYVNIQLHNGKSIVSNLLRAIQKGTPLPEHHGNLIDVNVLKNNIHYVPLAPIIQGDYVTYRNVIFCGYIGYATNHHRGE